MIFCKLQTIQKVLVAYAELVRKDFSQYTSKHDVVRSTAAPFTSACHFFIIIIIIIIIVIVIINNYLIIIIIIIVITVILIILYV